MKTAVVDDAEVVAGPGAPRRGRCVACGDQVALWHHPRGGWYYRHLPGAGRDCPCRVRPVRHEKIVVPPPLVRGSPALTLAVKLTSTVALDALNGDEEALAWLLEHPLPRMTLEALDIDADVAITRFAATVQDGGSSEQPLANRPTA